MKYFLIFLPFLSFFVFAQEQKKMKVTFTDGVKSEITIHSNDPKDATEHLLGFSMIHFKINNETPVGPFTPELIYYRFDPNNKLNFHANALLGLIDYRLFEKDNLAEFQFKRIQGHIGLDYTFNSNNKQKSTAMRWYNGYSIYRIQMKWAHAINYNLRGGFIYKQRGTGNTTVSSAMIDTLTVERTYQLEGFREGIGYVGISRTKKMYMLADGTGLGNIETTKYNELYLDFMASPSIAQYGRSHDYAEISNSNYYDVTSPSMKFDSPPFQNVKFGARIGGYQMTSRPKNPKSFFLLGWELGYFPGPKPHNFEGLFKFSWLFGLK